MQLYGVEPCGCAHPSTMLGICLIASPPAGHPHTTPGSDYGDIVSFENLNGPFGVEGTVLCDVPNPGSTGFRHLGNTCDHVIFSFSRC